jgi:hypothetical protein
MGARNSCFKAAWEQETAVLKPHGRYKQLPKSLCEVYLDSQEAAETYCGCHAALEKM